MEDEYPKFDENYKKVIKYCEEQLKTDKERLDYLYWNLKEYRNQDNTHYHPAYNSLDEENWNELLEKHGSIKTERPFDRKIENDIEYLKQKMALGEQESKKSIVESTPNSHPIESVNPEKDTVLIYWTTDGEKRLNITTFSNGIRDGAKVMFYPGGGTISKQQKLIRILIESGSQSVLHIARNCYCNSPTQNIIARIRTLISDIRQKLNKNNIPDIITPLGPDASPDSKIYLRVNAKKNLDRIKEYSDKEKLLEQIESDKKLYTEFIIDYFSFDNEE